VPKAPDRQRCHHIPDDALNQEASRRLDFDEPSQNAGDKVITGRIMIVCGTAATSVLS
jgi:hypothetical protein